MKKFLILLFIGAVFAMGIYDGGDVTGAVVLGLMFLPGMFEGKVKEEDNPSVSKADSSLYTNEPMKGGKVQCQIRTEDL